ncbi:MAG: SIMPL domain-containing protein [Rickettsiales bacterium]|nr:SIMPL domain-containing protein [Rickettsiales bacterium]
MKKIIYFALTITLALSFLILIIKKSIFTKSGYVTVKGSAERVVKADMVYWTITFVNAGNNLSTLKSKNSSDLKAIIDFLKENNFRDNEYEINPIELIDMDAREYRDLNQTNRYIMTQSISIITKNVDLVSITSQKLDSLIDKNISLKCGYGEMRPVYKFTKLNSIKQEMLKEATINAKKAAEQFAKDSKTKVGKIKYANQGLFNITPKNKSTSYGGDESFEKDKEVRVVITIDYWLK